MGRLRRIAESMEASERRDDLDASWVARPQLCHEDLRAFEELALGLECVCVPQA